jgi:hypothetical protein
MYARRMRRNGERRERGMWEEGKNGVNGGMEEHIFASATCASFSAAWRFFHASFSALRRALAAYGF